MMPDLRGTTWPQEYQDEIAMKLTQGRLTQDRWAWVDEVKFDCEIIREVCGSGLIHNNGFDSGPMLDALLDDLNDVAQYEHDSYLDSLDDGGNSMWVLAGVDYDDPDQWNGV